MNEKLNRKRTSVQKIIITSDMAGQRIDNFLLKMFKDIPKSKIYRIIRKGEVRINGGRIKVKYKLRCKDELRVPPLNIEPDQKKIKIKNSQSFEKTILFEDSELIVVNKPSGIAVHGGSGINYGLIEIIRAIRPDFDDLSLAHRIDRETSGCLLVTKKRGLLRILHEKFRTGKVVKNYLAIVHGNWQFDKKIINAALMVNHRENGERHVRIDEFGKESLTRVRLVSQYRNAALIQCQPLTGRTHQIRVHLSHIGYPIIGDNRYGVRGDNSDSQGKGANRLLLHAQSISFNDTSNNERLFIAPTPSEFDAFAIG
jgi:23S rRNA pseudouridine955/2504/2580 synthase